MPLPTEEDGETRLGILSAKERSAKYRNRELLRRLGEVSTQVEAVILEARQLVLWKAKHQPQTKVELTGEDRGILAASRKQRLADSLSKACAPLLKALSSHKWAFPFTTPVDTVKYFDYLDAIQTPMDLGSVKSRLDSGHYQDPKEFLSDVILVFDNAKKLIQQALTATSWQRSSGKWLRKSLTRQWHLVWLTNRGCQLWKNRQL